MSKHRSYFDSQVHCKFQFKFQLHETMKQVFIHEDRPPSLKFHSQLAISEIFHLLILSEGMLSKIHYK